MMFDGISALLDDCELHTGEFKLQAIKELATALADVKAADLPEKLRMPYASARARLMKWTARTHWSHEFDVSFEADVKSMREAIEEK